MIPEPVRASGIFEVKLTRHSEEENGGTSLGRMTIEKQYQGDLEAGSKGQMLTAGTGVQGSAGYVALEQVTGMLHGRRGSFILQHSGTMTRGTPGLSITVVPDSGAGELAGLSGRMDIQVTGGQHRYQFEYSLGE